MRRRTRKTGPSAKQRPPAETHAGAKSPHSGAINAKRLTKVSTQGLGGGVRSHLRTGLERKFPANRENKGNIAILGPQKPISLQETAVLQRLFTKFPTHINRENILRNRQFSSGN